MGRRSKCYTASIRAPSRQDRPHSMCELRYRTAGHIHVTDALAVAWPACVSQEAPIWTPIGRTPGHVQRALLSRGQIHQPERVAVNVGERPPIRSPRRFAVYHKTYRLVNAVDRVCWLVRRFGAPGEQQHARGKSGETEGGTHTARRVSDVKLCDVRCESKCGGVCVTQNGDAATRCQLLFGNPIRCGLPCGTCCEPRGVCRLSLFKRCV